MRVNADPRPAVEWYLEHLEADADRFAAVLDAASPDTAVPACPGWDVGRLAEHLGQIHRWAAFCATNGRAPSEVEAAALESYDPSRAADWYRGCAAELLDALRATDPDAPTWHPFPVEQVGRFWFRRQAHETALHRWDAQQAVDAVEPIDPQLAGDGIDEYLEAVVPRIVARRGVTLPPGSLHLHCTDVDGEWLVFVDDDGYRLVRAHQKGDAALRGPAEAILLRVWGRTSGRAGELSPVGDDAVLADWLAIGGA